MFICACLDKILKLIANVFVVYILSKPQRLQLHLYVPQFHSKTPAAFVVVSAMEWSAFITVPFQCFPFKTFTARIHSSSPALQHVTLYKWNYLHILFIHGTKLWSETKKSQSNHLNFTFGKYPAHFVVCFNFRSWCVK